MERRRRDWKAGRAHLPSSSSSQSANSTYQRPKFPSNASRNPENYNRNPSTGKQRIKEGEDSCNLPSVIGTCPDMCPARERAQRERLRDLSVFERLNGNPGRTSSTLAVKKFCRTMSTMDMQASDVRPLPVLRNTLKYLFNLLDSSEQPFEVVHDFVFDRTRSIRQDLGMQNIISDQSIHMYEEMVKFHIISHHKLMRCSGDSNISSLHYLNMEQLMKSLVSLFDLYDINQKSSSINKNAAEFYSFYVLLHLAPNSQPMGESLSLWLRQLPSTVIKSKEMCFARSLLRHSRMGNYKRFFSIIAAEASHLQFFLIEPFINEVRAIALSYINHGNYKLHPYPLAHLSELLMMKESEVESLCNACGLETSTDEAGIKLVPTKQTGFCLPKGGFQNYSFLGLERLQRQAAFNDARQAANTE
ncbi:SAC3 family protein C [Magnolia sinica]|uniref:SAC3 family protein C n=1 Tax=Magnolia sinica TaxID=86752 RepID=UPI0026585621|nr:SAC3 family protein C [Magnolia sinica]XP_058107324.1 SAC3 family protein C [Magnolia sinica]